jgi:hypothetical protein
LLQLAASSSIAAIAKNFFIVVLNLKLLKMLRCFSHITAANLQLYSLIEQQRNTELQFFNSNKF